jgi:hypothetical protein
VTNVFDDVQVASLAGDRAIFSNDRRYRYMLTRDFGPGPAVAWVGLNPSTADEQQDDPTIRRIIGFSRREGFGRLIMLNLYGYRSTDPSALASIEDPCGPANVSHFLRECAAVDTIVCAWGAWWKQRERTIVESPLRAVLRSQAPGTPEIPARWRVRCLGYTASGEPRHPLYVHRDTAMIEWVPGAADVPEQRVVDRRERA